MTGSRYFGGFMAQNYQSYIIDYLTHNDELIEEIAHLYVSKSPVKSPFEMVKQLVAIMLVQLLFNFVPCQAYLFLNNGFAPKIKTYIKKFSTTFPGRTFVSQRSPILFDIAQKQIVSALSNLIDDFYGKIGSEARKIFKSNMASTKRRIEPPDETFIGIIAPSILFTAIDPLNRARLLPYFNAMQYQAKEKISSITELYGKLKKIELDGDNGIYRLAGRLGFVMGVPEEKKFYYYFKEIEQILGKNCPCVDLELIHSNLIDFKVQSIDGSNIPVDKRDLSASNGSGSRGPFFGQKTSVGVDSNCIPIYAETSTGRTSDITLFYPTFDYIYSLAYGSNQEIWALTLDAGYSSTYVIDYLEDRQIIPFVDLNTRQSKLLKELKCSAIALQKLSKKAIKEGLTKKKRKDYLADLKMYQNQHRLKLNLDEKKKSFERSFTNMSSGHYVKD